MFFSLRGSAPGECAQESLPLPAPSTPDLLVVALEQLIEVGVVPSIEAALDALARAQYVFDPDEDSQLEYWIVFRGAGGEIAAEFNFTCPLDEENFPLDIEFEGVRQLG